MDLNVNLKVFLDDATSALIKSSAQQISFLATLVPLMNAKLDILTGQEEKALMDLQAITDSVAQVLTVEDSAITLLNHVADTILANVADQAKLQDFAASLRDKSNQLAAAVAAVPDPSAPPAPAPAPVPPPAT